MRIPTIFQGLVASGTIAAITFLSLPVIAQNAPVDLSGIWWAGAAVPLLPGESPAMGMGMGMGTNSSALVQTDYGRELMVDFDPADDPAVSCVQAGLVRQITSPYPLAIIQTADTVTIEYEEWAILRTIHLNAEIPADLEPSPMGYSVGHYEDAALIIDSTGATRGLPRISEFFWTSEEVSTVERYSLTERGQLRLELDVTDPIMLAEPLHYEKIWNPYAQPLLDFDCILRER
jgi:hypothetical protein